MIAGKPVIGPAGKAYGFSYGARQAPVLLGAQLEKDEAKRIKIEQILDYIATNDEFWLLTVFGQKGVNYDQDGVVVPKTIRRRPLQSRRRQLLQPARLD